MITRPRMTIYSPDGAEILTVEVGSGSKVVADLMTNDYVKLAFVTDVAYRFRLGSYILVSSEKTGVEAKKYILTSLVFPSYDAASGGYRYDIQFDAWYRAWKRYLLTLAPTYGCVQTSFSYTQKLVEHFRLIIKQLEKLKADGDQSITMPNCVYIHFNGKVEQWRYEDEDFYLDDEWTTTPVDENTNEATFLVKDELKMITYDSTDIITAIGQMCAEDAFNCEWWVDDEMCIHFGRCEYGNSVELEHGVDFETLQRNPSSDEYGTRIVAFGAATNVPSRYRKKLEYQITSVRTKNGYTFFTDANRKTAIKHNTSQKYLGFVASAQIPHSQSTYIGHDNIDVETSDSYDSIMSGYMLARKTTTWQKRELYDCVLKRSYAGHNVVSYECSGGEKFVIKGTPSQYAGHYLYRIKGQDSTTFGDYINSYSSVGDLNVEVRIPDDTACSLDVTVSGTIEVVRYDSTIVAYHNIANVNASTLPELEPGSYRVSVSHLDMDFRINGEFECDSQQSEVDIEVYEKGVISMDIINDSSDYVDVPDFDIEIQTLDYFIRPVVRFVSGAKANTNANAYINVDDTTINRSSRKVKTSPLSNDSFELAIYGTNTGIKVGDRFTVDGFIETAVPLSYFSDQYSVNTNIAGYERRIMLPVSSCPGNYIDADNIESATDIQTVVKVFDDIYPSQEIKVAKVETYTEKVQRYDDNGSVYYEDAVRFRFFVRKTGDYGITFKKAYITEGASLQAIFQDGLLGGMTFGIEFEGETATTDDDGNALQAYLVVNNSESGIDMPNKLICPKVGDKLVLLNYNPTSLSEMGFITDAEARLYTRAKAYLDKISLDAATYTMTMLSSAAERICEAGTGFARIGQKVALTEPAYFDGQRQTRVIGYELNLDIPFDSPVYKIGESLRYSRIGSIEKQLK